MKTIELDVEKRSTTGKNEARRDREAGRIPAVVYGAGKPNVPVSVNRKALADVFREGAGENAIFLLKLAGSDQSRHAMIKEMQRDPVSRRPLHIDFVRVLMDVKVTLKVPIEIVGTARGVKADAGILDLVTREIEIECLPSNIPAHIAVDVSDLGIGDAIRVAQIPAVEGVTIIDNPEKVVVHVAHPTREEEPVAAAEGAVEPAEPEVLKKGKVVTEEEAAEEKKEGGKKEKKEKEK
ncbi:MAG TPA: 50S ribosomal protein L25 [Thermoanaerobaculia bacterium]|jgi:large subunit ribosomal protein L25|nr:50S ribosomal protein L25 [Thermoanaerobaculia bacterium]